MANASSLAFLPPRLDPRVLAAARLLLPLWLRSHGLRRLQVDGMERLEEAMGAFQDGRCRLLLAFRHPSLDDPAVLARLLWHQLPLVGRARSPAGRRRFQPRPHAQFLYDRGIPLWAGAPMGWLLAHLGGCSIQRGTLDLPALRTARALLLDGPHPFAVAPEGATNGHNERISPLEPGVAQLALWTADDLAKAGRQETSLILPVGVQYSFLGTVWPAIEVLLLRLEQEAGLPLPAQRSLEPERLYGRLLRLAERILDRMERFYRQLQPLPMAEPPHEESGAPGPAGQPAGAGSSVGVRLERLLDTALQVAEQALDVEPHGDRSSRCRRLEQAGWERIYPANGSLITPGSEETTAAGPSLLEQSLSRRLAEETERKLWHMRLAESFVAVSGDYVRACPSQERFADTLLILWDTLNRIHGASPGPRPSLGPRLARIRVGDALNASSRLPAYRADRRTAVAALTTALQGSLEGLIVPSLQSGSAALPKDQPDQPDQPAASRDR